MDVIIRYLKNPMEVGVYNLKCILDFSGVVEYLKELMDAYKESAEKGRTRKTLANVRIARVSEALKEFEELNRIFRSFAALNNFPENLRKFFYREREIKLPTGEIKKRRVPKLHPTNIFDSYVDAEIKEVFVIEKEHIKHMTWLIDVVTIKEDGLSAFKKCLECLPPLKEGIKILKERKHSSTRYAFRPYPFATRLWLQDDISINVPPDLKSFLHGAVNYIFSDEWRTSIVLSAICVESVLADLYEETHKKPAPDVPLGDLFRQVKDKIDFPQDIVRAIEITNEARISAIHRSRFPVSDREAINVLYGATNLLLWYISQF